MPTGRGFTESDFRGTECVSMSENEMLMKIKMKKSVSDHEGRNAFVMS
jgi:hypothetical protein